MHVGDFIKKYREEHNLSMQDFANLTGLSKAYVGMLEKVYNPETQKPISPSVDKMNQIAKGMGMSLDELLVHLGESKPLAIRLEHKQGPETTMVDEELPTLSPRDECQIAKELEEIMKDLDERERRAVNDITPEDAEDRELLRASLLTTLRLAKRIAKKKFTPKKFRK